MEALVIFGYTSLGTAAFMAIFGYLWHRVMEKTP